MEKLRTVRGVHDLLPNELHNHNEVINAGLEISDSIIIPKLKYPYLNLLKFLQDHLENQVIL